MDHALKKVNVYKNEILQHIPLGTYFRLEGFVKLSEIFPQENEQHSYSTLKSKTTSAKVSGLKPGTSYIFQIRARTSAGCGRFSPSVEIQTGKAGEELTYCYQTSLYGKIVVLTVTSFKENFKANHSGRYCTFDSVILFFFLFKQLHYLVD